MKYNVTVTFEGEADMTVEANSPEEAERIARMDFSWISIDDVDIVCVDVLNDDETPGRNRGWQQSGMKLAIGAERK